MIPNCLRKIAVQNSREVRITTLNEFMGKKIMAGSLFDQLKKTGLIDEQKAKQAKKEKYQHSKKNKVKKGHKEKTLATKMAEEAVQKKIDRDRQLNLERQEVQNKKAQRAELVQLIESNLLSGYEGEEVYSFADDKLVKSLNVNVVTRKKLVTGRIRIARFKGGYVLVPEITVDKIEQRDSNTLISLVVADNTMSQEDKDYYTKFEIPDDLVW